MQLNINYIPTSAQASVLGYSIPTSANWTFPTSNFQTPQLILCQGLQTLLGFNNYTTFPQSIINTNYVYVSDSTPILSPVFVYTFLCNLLDSGISNVPTILHQLPLTSSFGNLVTYNAATESKLNCRNSSFTEITITVLDQNLNQIYLNDPELALTLILVY
jgi:hypothetical protein